MPESTEAELPTETPVPAPAAEPPPNPVKTSKWANLLLEQPLNYLLKV